MSHYQESNILELAKPNLLHFSEATNEITPSASASELAVGKSGVPKHSRQKICTPRERQKHTAAGGHFQCLRLPSACNRGDSSGVGWSAIICIASDNHISYLYIYMPRPYLYLNLSLHRHTATTSDPMRWRGSSAEHVCWRRSAVRWAWGRTGPFRRAPATTPSPSEPGPSLLVLVLAAVGALQLRRSRHDGATSRCAGTWNRL
jgi:hypothetical protein